MQKKVLIITYYWPPAGGPGVQRWLKFVKYLPEYDIQPIIYCPKNPNYPIYDDSLNSEVSKDLIVLKQPIKEPYRFAKLVSKQDSNSISSGVIPQEKKQSFIQKLMLFVRGNFFIPDARISWVTPSVNYLLDYIKEESIQTIITTGPPHSLHLIGLKLKQQLGVKWIADFRDPWTTIGYHKKLKLTESSKRKHLLLEERVLNAADQIIVTSGNTKKEFQDKTKQPISVITNGYDVHKIKKPTKDSQFTLAHVGSLLSERNPINLWHVLNELINDNMLFKKHFRLKLIGVISDSIIQELEKFNLKDYVDVVGYVSHKEAQIAQMQSQLVLLIEIDSEDTKAIIPGKLFEYMVSETPIIAIGPRDTDVEQIINDTQTGSYFYYDAKHSLKSQLLSYFDAYLENNLSSKPVGLKNYSRKELTANLAKLI